MKHILIVLGLSVLIGLLILLLTSTSKQKGGYDERQVAARGRAFEVSFFFLLTYNLIIGAADYLFAWNWTANTFVFGCIGALFALMIWCVMCIWNNAYIRTQDTPAAQMMVIGILGIGQILMYFTKLTDEQPLIYNNQVQTVVLHLGLGIVFVIVEITFLLRRYLDKKAEAKEAEEE